MRVVIEVQADPQLPQVVLALQSPRRLLRPLDGWKQQGDDHGDHADRHGQVNQGEAVGPSSAGPTPSRVLAGSNPPRNLWIDHDASFSLTSLERSCLSQSSDDDLEGTRIPPFGRSATDHRRTADPLSKSLPTSLPADRRPLPRIEKGTISATFSRDSKALAQSSGSARNRQSMVMMHDAGRGAVHGESRRRPGR